MFILFVPSFVILGRLLTTGELAIFAVAWVFEKLQHVRKNAWEMCLICEFSVVILRFSGEFTDNNTLLNYWSEIPAIFHCFRRNVFKSRVVYEECFGV